MKNRTSNFTCLILIAITLLLNACTTKTKVPVSPEQDVLVQLLGKRANEFVLTLDTLSTTKGDYFEVDAKPKEVRIKASSKIALTYGAYYYLKQIGAAFNSWEGTALDLPAKWPKKKLRKQTPFKFRKYLNVVTYGYTTPWWDWERWNQEINWMALHGINMPTAMEGQEYIWQKLWKEYGVTQAELDKHFTGPAFLPWQRMGNINGHAGPLPQEWITKKAKLQKKILSKMRDLGMKPVVPAFSGYIPAALAEKFPNAKISELNGWSGGGFDSTYLLDPKDPLFKEIGKRFIELYNQEYGKAEYYLADSFNEVTPPVSTENKLDELAAYGQVIYETLNEAAPGATWVMQGWLFGHDAYFWEKDAVIAFLSKVPNDKLIIQDFGNDRYKVWEKQDAFYGKQWTYGYVHNYGGSNPIYGDFDFYKEEINYLLEHDKSTKVLGYGVMPEGLHQNSMVYEYLYDLPWDSKIPVKDWLKTNIKARYGKDFTKETLTAWIKLDSAVYSTKYWTPRWWNDQAGAYLLFKQPSKEITAFKGHPTNLKLLEEANLLLEKNKENNPLIQEDFIAHKRHELSLKIDTLLQQATYAYINNDFEKGDSLQLQFHTLIDSTEQLLENSKLDRLDYWVQEATNYGDTPETKAFYKKNARLLINQWGGVGNLNNYASRAWKDQYQLLYKTRWDIYLGSLRVNSELGGELNQERIEQNIKEWDELWLDYPH
ncbi:alpha-N-acetylglucosaminidase [Croceivirga radicis]|uniref:alpha-N-acetylglucosaminidase n=1 Tax=Croceivirga radicis TaxID=1929488 RepID=UPI000255ABF7|nr:alpha-N-acetylglucosaminidase [Croceivirga radicis]